MIHHTTLGERLLLARRRRHLTLREVAALLDISFSVVGKWERDESEPNISTMHQLADLYGVDVCWLAFGRETPEIHGRSSDHPVMHPGQMRLLDARRVA